MKLLSLLISIVIFLALTFLLGPICVDFILLHTTHHTIGYLWALLLSFITCDFVIPVAIVVKVLVLLGILA